MRMSVFVCSNVCERSEKQGEDREILGEFRSTTKKFENVRLFLLRDMNARVRGREIGGVVGGYGVEGINENGQHLVDICAERGVVPLEHLLSAQNDTQVYLGKGEC